MDGQPKRESIIGSWTYLSYTIKLLDYFIVYFSIALKADVFAL